MRRASEHGAHAEPGNGVALAASGYAASSACTSATDELLAAA